MNINTKAIGDSGEKQAAGHLQNLGYEILERNVRGRRAEIDIIARRGDTLFFVEVKKQQGVGYGGAAAHVDRRKRHKIARQATAYLAESGWAGLCGFLVVAIDGANIEVIEDFLL